MRCFLIGLYSGLVLSVLRAPLGLDLLQIPAREPTGSAAWRAGALAISGTGLALALRKRPGDFSPATWLAGATTGFTAHWILGGSASHLTVQVVFSLLLVLLILAAHRGGPDTRPSVRRLVGAAAVAVAGWVLLSGGSAGGNLSALLLSVLGLGSIVAIGALAAPRGSAAPDPASPSGLGGLAGATVAGAGLALLVEGVARHLRLLGGGLMLDDGVFGSVFAALAFVGAIAFARLFRSGSSRALGRGVLLGASGLVAWTSLRVLGNVSGPGSLDRFVRRFGLDLSHCGMGDWDALLAAPTLVAPAFLVGTVLALYRRPAELAGLLVGGGAGTLLAPSLLAYRIGPGSGGGLEVISSSHSAGLAMAGAALAAVGGLFAATTARGIGARSRAIGGTVTAAGTALALLLPVRAITVLSPWEIRPPQPELVLEAPEGLITVEHALYGGLMATLDRRPLCPPPEAISSDRARIELSWRLLSEAQRSGSPRVLLVGQLSLARALALIDLGAARVDRTASWHRAMPMLEEALCDGPPRWLPGEVLTLGEAGARLERGDFDLVLVLPVPGEPAAVPAPDAPEGTTVVVWLDAASGYERETLDAWGGVLVKSSDLVELEFALARGPGIAEGSGPSAFGDPAFLSPGVPIPSPPPGEELQTRLPERRRIHRAALAGRLAGAERTPGIASGLAVHFAAQRESSPWDPWELQVELEDEAMERFREAALDPVPASTAVGVAEALAVVLRGKRRVEEIGTYLAPLAEKHAPWPAVEVALAHADLELLDPETAVQRLSRLLESWRGDPPAWAMLAEAHQQLRNEEQAMTCLERALDLLPGDHELERRLAIARVRAGDAGGEAAVRALLAEEPEDPELLRYLEPGPFPDVEAGYHPLGTHRHH